jgi:hypothetical protein
MLPNNFDHFNDIKITNTCCICKNNYKDFLGGYKNTKISTSCTCDVVNDNICDNCKDNNNLKCPKCNSPVQLFNVLY